MLAQHAMSGSHVGAAGLARRTQRAKACDPATRSPAESLADLDGPQKARSPRSGSAAWHRLQNQVGERGTDRGRPAGRRVVRES